LARDPALWRQLRDRPEKIPAFVQEVVRFGSPATVTARQVARNVDLAGVPLKKGALLFLLWGSGSHDERHFDTPREIRLDRPNGRNHTSFGSGTHYCAGVYLARSELELSVQAWLKKFTSFELAVPEEQISYVANFGTRALSRL